MGTAVVRTRETSYRSFVILLMVITIVFIILSKIRESAEKTMCAGFKTSLDDCIKYAAFMNKSHMEACKPMIKAWEECRKSF